MLVRMRHSVRFITGIAVILVTLFACSSSIVAESNPTTTKPVTQTAQKSQTRWIEIDLSEQQLYGWEGKKLAYYFEVSTGKKSTPTPTGKFLIGAKYRYNRMRGSDYDIPDVPYAMYFYKGYAIHGAYWHNKFGIPVSHGCVNLRVKDARKLYNWSKLGTLVVVHE
ncbi:MAG: L,D-transpeptidase [Calothrix sp. MO_167.B12]|nr:L,D-transpeptidase [Calothrix sp. MO_167.B12]